MVECETLDERWHRKFYPRHWVWRREQLARGELKARWLWFHVLPLFTDDCRVDHGLSLRLKWRKRFRHQ